MLKTLRSSDRDYDNIKEGGDIDERLRDNFCCYMIKLPVFTIVYALFYFNLIGKTRSAPDCFASDSSLYPVESG